MNITTDRLLMRPIQMDDKQDIFNYRSDAETNKYQGWIPKTLDDVEAFFKSIATQINKPDSWFQFVIIEKETDAIIGDFGIHFIGEMGKQTEIGCTLDKNHHGKGYATEAAKGIINYLFKDLKKHRIVTSIDPDNADSIRLVERLGFTKEAHFRESLFIDGKWVDDIVYALLESDWA